MKNVSPHAISGPRPGPARTTSTPAKVSATYLMIAASSTRSPPDRDDPLPSLPTAAGTPYPPSRTIGPRPRDSVKERDSRRTTGRSGRDRLLVLPEKGRATLHGEL